MKKIEIISATPELLKSPFSGSIMKRAIEKGIVEIKFHDLKEYSVNNKKQIDDYQFGGGSGMVMMCEPLFGAIEYCISKSEKKPKIIFPSPKGKVLNHSLSSNLSTESSLIFICGHYKGVDERVIEKYVDFEISIGDFIISNGELSTMIIFDSIVRLVPGVLNDINSALTDSFVDDLLDAPYFTRPSEIDGLKVPDVLLSGDHKAIEKWRNDKKLELTKERRPDLLEKD